MCLLVRNHRCWIFTVLFVAVLHVDHGRCQDSFFKTYFQNRKEGFVKTGEKTYHAKYEFDLDDTLQQTGRFFKRFTDALASAVTDPPHEDEDDIQETTVSAEDGSHEDETEEYFNTTEVTVEPSTEEEQTPTEETQIPAEETEIPAEETEIPVEETQTPAVETQTSAKEDTNVAKKPTSKLKSSKKKKKFKKKSHAPFVLSILNNLKLLISMPIKISKYERKHCSERKAQCPSEDYCDLVT